MRQLWIICVEMSVPPGTLESGRTLAFTNWVTWAESSEQAVAGVKEAAASHSWHILGLERAETFDDALEYDESIAELIEHATENPEAVLFGTFHTHPAQ